MKAPSLEALHARRETLRQRYADLARCHAPRTEVARRLRQATLEELRAQLAPRRRKATPAKAREPAPDLFATS